MIPRRADIGLVQRPFPAIVLVWLGVSTIIALASPHLAAARFPDVDDTMRLLQVRDLLAGQDWFDLRQYRINPPEGTLMHWSRLVDAPLAGLIWLLSHVLPAARAEFLVAFAAPLLLMLMTMLAVGRIALQRFGLRVTLLAIGAFALMPMVPAQFQPLRIDHHGWQILMVALALWAVFQSHAVRGGTIAGLAMAAGLVISLETVVMAAGFALLFTWRWLADPAARVWLVRYLQALAGGLAAFFALTRGVADLAAHCDAIAPAHLGLFGTIAVGVSVLGLASPASRLMVLGGLAASGLAGIAVLGATAPACLASPFAGLDPLVRDLWYLRVTEGMPVWQQPIGEAFSAVVQCLVALGVAIVCAARGDEGLRDWWREYALVLAVAILGGLATWRSIAFAGIMCTIPLAVLAARVIDLWQGSARLPARLAAAIAIYLVFLPAPAALALDGLLHRTGAINEPEIFPSTCDIHNTMRHIDRLPAGIVFAPLDIGPPLLLDTHHSIIGSGHHRSASGMRDVIAAFTGNQATAHQQIAAHRADYVVVCTDVVEFTNYRAAGGPDSFANALVAGPLPDWLEPVDLPLPDALRVWKVVRPSSGQAGPQPR
ncbi:MAG: hypothetical protein V2I74_03585 [Erythrobacter sp.]|jgi:hypothetical protein|nr:hypothetical protein [Erythrobacter sp.]